MHSFSSSSSSYHERKAEIMSKYRPIAPKPSAAPLPDKPAPLLPRKRGAPGPTTYPEKKTTTTRCLSLFPTTTTRVIAPRAVRPVWSSISVRHMEEVRGGGGGGGVRRPEEVEKEVEMEALPAVISDSSNRVRMTNSAYKELVGQPECAWVDSGRGGRIEGVVELRFCQDKMVVMREASNGFSCLVAIEWADTAATAPNENENEKKKMRCVSTFCDAIRLACVSRDYAFAWRFHTNNLSPF